jgi:hypothetical protein
VTVAPPSLDLGLHETTGPERARLGAALLVLGVALTVTPLWAMPAIVLGLAVAWHRLARFAASCTWLGMCVLAAAVARTQLLESTVATASWPSRFASLHRPMLFCAVALAVLALALEDEDPAREGATGP